MKLSRNIIYRKSPRGQYCLHRLANLTLRIQGTDSCTADRNQDLDLATWPICPVVIQGRNGPGLVRANISNPSTAGVAAKTMRKLPRTPSDRHLRSAFENLCHLPVVAGDTTFTSRKKQVY